jgi:hypothetical protein
LFISSVCCFLAPSFKWFLSLLLSFSAHLNDLKRGV